MKKNNFCKLYTREGENLSGIPHNTYPRPQQKRDSFFNLNGEWDFAVTDGSEPTEYDKKILVPFPPQSLLSGIEEQYKKGDMLFYRRRFSLPDGFVKNRVILHIGAADQVATVYLNGNTVGEHKGGYLPFSFDVTDCLKDDNELVISVYDDPTSTVLPYGKQREKRGGMWYTPVSGIWQTVWCESVPSEYIKSLKIDTNGAAVRISADGIKSGTLTLDGRTYPVTDGICEFSVENPVFWSPENPHLYYFTICAGEDKVESYFALRTLEIKKVGGVWRLCLNGKPYFFNGLLDQGYFSDGIYTPADLSLFEQDILSAKSMGFNMLRKHIKIEPEQFYYDCDRLGMVVFQDMVNNGDYSFLRDTALPTVGLKKLNDKLLHRNKRTREEFLSAMEDTVKLLYNHPSICLWTIFNEGWGQFDSTAAYKKLKALDSSRFIDSASGWFKGGENDVESEHVYFKPYRHKNAEKPVILSEFGGYALKTEGHIFNPDNQYGYRSFNSKEALTDAIASLYEHEVVPAAKRGLCAAVYTQLTDVEDETNGLITYDRKVLKVNTERLRTIFADLENI